MKLTGKNTWKFDDSSWRDGNINVMSTYVEQKTVCDIRANTKEIRFNYEWFHIDDIKKIIEEFDMQQRDAARRFSENENGLIKESYELESSSNNS